MIGNRYKILFFSLSTALIILGLSLPYPSPSQAGDKMFFANVLPENSYRVKWYKLLYAEAFRRLKTEFEFRQYPMKRAPYLANQGELDGEIGRVKNFNSVYQNLVRVDEPLWTVKFVAYAVDASITLEKWESLINTKYRVNYRRGVKRCEEMLPKMLTASQLESVTADFQGLGKLIKGRIDVYIGLESIVDPILNTNKFKDTPIRKAGIMEIAEIYTFLHKKHIDKVPRLEAIFREMKNEGLFELYDVLASE